MRFFKPALGCLLLAGCSDLYVTEIDRLESRSEGLEDDINMHRSSIRILQRRKDRVDRQIEVFDRRETIEEGL
jgi:outer membrane murein-binding lipoprotein Lpp